MKASNISLFHHPLVCIAEATFYSCYFLPGNDILCLYSPVSCIFHLSALSFREEEIWWTEKTTIESQWVYFETMFQVHSRPFLSDDWKFVELKLSKVYIRAWKEVGGSTKSSKNHLKFWHIFFQTKTDVAKSYRFSPAGELICGIPYLGPRLRSTHESQEHQLFSNGWTKWCDTRAKKSKVWMINLASNTIIMGPLSRLWNFNCFHFALQNNVAQVQVHFICTTSQQEHIKHINNYGSNITTNQTLKGHGTAPRGGGGTQAY